MEDNKQKETIEFRDDFIKQFVQKGQRNISNENFDSDLMSAIYRNVQQKKEVNSNLKRSLYFFYFAIALITFYALISIIGTSTVSNATNLVPILVLFFTLAFGIALMGRFKKLLQSSYI